MDLFLHINPYIWHKRNNFACISFHETVLTKLASCFGSHRHHQVTASLSYFYGLQIFKKSMFFLFQEKSKFNFVFYLRRDLWIRSGLCAWFDYLTRIWCVFGHIPKTTNMLSLQSYKSRIVYLLIVKVKLDNYWYNGVCHQFLQYFIL